MTARGWWLAERRDRRLCVLTVDLQRVLCQRGRRGTTGLESCWPLVESGIAVCML